MAGSLDIRGTANLLLGLGLARLNEEGIEVSASLEALSGEADRSTLVGIARLLLERNPPPWISTAIVEDAFAPEFVPNNDLRTLSWLDDDLEAILIAVNRRISAGAEDDRRKILGNAGELVVMSALRREGYRPVHVALISDGYGYDIENRSQSSTQRIEVKSSVEATKGGFFLSRNEYDKAAAFGEEWRLVQVVFSSRAVVDAVITAKDVKLIREISGAMVLLLAPTDTQCFRWVESAEFRPQDEVWRPSSLKVDPEFRYERPKLP